MITEWKAPTPYTYVEYPRTMHQWPERTRTVRNDEEKAAALADGWSLLPVMSAPVEVVPVEEPPAPIADVPRRGRKARA